MLDPFHATLARHAGPCRLRLRGHRRGLPFIPLAARRVLDVLGRKLSLEGVALAPARGSPPRACRRAPQAHVDAARGAPRPRTPRASPCPRSGARSRRGPRRPRRRARPLRPLDSAALALASRARPLCPRQVRREPEKLGAPTTRSSAWTDAPDARRRGTHGGRRRQAGDRPARRGERMRPHDGRRTRSDRRRANGEGGRPRRRAYRGHSRGEAHAGARPALSSGAHDARRGRVRAQPGTRRAARAGDGRGRRPDGGRDGGDGRGRRRVSDRLRHDQERGSLGDDRQRAPRGKERRKERRRRATRAPEGRSRVAERALWRSAPGRCRSTRRSSA